MNRIAPVLSAVLLLFFIGAVQADIIFFKVTGNEGDGLLGGNVNPTAPTNPGSGGIGSTGIFLDTDTNTLHIDIEWGSGNGYTDMTDVVTMVHLHGMTADPAPQSFNQVNSNILINVGNSLNFDNSASSGGVIDDFFIGNPDIPGLLEGRTYLNIHTAANSGGEIRGYLVVVPEPASMAVCLVVVGLMIARRQRTA